MVKAWSEYVVIPTYEVGEAEKNPIFLEKRVYQGSSGRVYPHPVIENISDNKTDKEWLVCFLENDYLKIMILPELGGRVQMAYDKIKERHFVYYNEVIKPALVGLTGPWISGGIEFNWPQHHRPSTYDPVDYCIEEFDDGSKTVWCSEIERMFRTKGMTGFTLYPDKAYLEIKVKLFNRTSEPQTFLWWANPAVAVNDHYQSVFPPDVNAVFDHGKRDVSTFPVATGTYYKVDYSEGVDISRYKNIPVPTSYMAIESAYDFVGGYEHDTQAGMLHVADHHISPGKKQWTWGCGNFGKAWDRNLTDRNGPYIELMCGVYTDNQPDFSWLMPYEEKSFKQYFMPYHELGMVKNASKDLLLNLEIKDGSALIRILSTGHVPNASINLKSGNVSLFEDDFNFQPSSTYIREVGVDTAILPHQFSLSISDEKGKMLLSWSPEAETDRQVPDAARAALSPKEIKSNDELYLNGLHLEQYRHASFEPEDYYLEALSRDPEDSRNNNAMGLLLHRRGRFHEAEHYFRSAIRRLTSRNPNPYDGEPLFNLGMTLRFQGKHMEAYKAFSKAAWNTAWVDSSCFQMAQIDIMEEKWESAKEHISRSLHRNYDNHKARHLKIAILRIIGENEEAGKLIRESLDLDPFNFGALYESYLCGKEDNLAELEKLIRDNIHNYVELALDYAWAGMFSEAISVLDLGIQKQNKVYPMAFYYKAWFQYQSGDSKTARSSVLKAEDCAPDYCFPHQLEAIPALELAVQLLPEAAKAPYYLGNFWYNARQYSLARTCFEQSAKLGNSFPTVYRNLALVLFNKFDEKVQALNYMEKAFMMDQSDARVLMELDQLFRKMNKSPEFRYEMLAKYPVLVEARDDLYLQQIELLVMSKQYKKAYDLLMNRKFHPWEGGEGKVSGAYVKSLTGMAIEAYNGDRFEEALEFLSAARTYPENLGEGKLFGTQENELNYWMACSYDALGDHNQSRKYWELASEGLSEPCVAWYYNDQQPDTIYFQGLALLRLDRVKDAHERFNKLIDYGEKHLNDEISLDYFAVSLPDLQIWEEDLNKRNRIHCNYMIALGYKGKNDDDNSQKYFNEVLYEDACHAGALTYR